MIPVNFLDWRSWLFVIWTAHNDFLLGNEATQNVNLCSICRVFIVVLKDYPLLVLLA